MLWFCTLHVLVYVVLPICLSWEIKYVYVGLYIMYACVVCWAFLHLVYILVGSCERLMEHPILGEWCALWPHNPKNVCTWGIPSSFDITRLSSHYVVYLLMRNPNSKVSINYLLLVPLLHLGKFFIGITLWGSNILCAYYKPRKCVNLRYCHLELIV